MNYLFDKDSFDGIFSVSVWHLLDDTQRAAREFSRVLKPKGSFFIVTADLNKGLRSLQSISRGFDNIFPQ